MFGTTATAGAAFLLVFVLGSLPAGQQVQIGQRVVDDNRVDVSVYYESLCPDSKHFIAAQLTPTWASLKQYMNLRLIPFGKAASRKMIDGSFQFSCQHGPRECNGNRMQSCALSLIPTQDKQERFVNCVMTAYDPLVASPTCAEAVELNYGDVEHCYATDQGQALQLEAETETNSIRRPLDFVPTIVYNNIFDQDKQDMSLHDFKGCLCSQIPSPPAECSQ